MSPATATVAMSLALVRAGGTVLLAGLKEGRSVELAVTALNEKRVDTVALRGAVLDLDHIDDALDLLLRRDRARDAVRVTIRHNH
ncbi:MAG: hypothetical protein ABI658_26840 [Acidimicrobiales bacterium]